MDLLLGTFSLYAILFLSGTLAEVDPTRGCQTVEVPMCKGLIGYNLTRLPNQFNHRTQSEVYWALQPWWPFMDLMCSTNLRLLLCGLYLPKCTPGSPRVQLPCRETCRKAKVRCSQDMQRQGRPWNRDLRCPQFLPKRTNRCIQPIPEKKKKKQRGYVMCQQNTMSVCSGVEEPYTHGSLPNMFLQGNMDLMDKELQQYLPLIQSGCSPHLQFFLCGVFMPFCVHQRQVEIPFVVPCRELCQEVYDNCHSEFTRTRNGLPWPGKLHCHRYPSYLNSYGNNQSLPCTMHPHSRRHQSPIELSHQEQPSGTLNSQPSNRQVNRQVNRQTSRNNQPNTRPNRVNRPNRPNRQNNRQHRSRQGNRQNRRNRFRTGRPRARRQPRRQVRT